MRLSKKRYLYGGKYGISKSDPKKPEPSQVPLGVETLPQDATSVATGLSAQQMQGMDQDQALSWMLQQAWAMKQLQEQKDILGYDPSFSGGVESFSPMTYLSPAGDVIAALEATGDILKGDYIKGGAGLGLAAASVFLPGNIKVPKWIDKLENPQKIMDAVEYIGALGGSSHPMGLIDEFALDSDEIYDVIMFLNEGAASADVGVLANIDRFSNALAEYVDEIGDEELQGALDDAFSDSLTELFSEASEWYSTEEGKDAFFKRARDLAVKSGQYRGPQTDMLIEEAANVAAENMEIGIKPMTEEMMTKKPNTLGTAFSMPEAGYRNTGDVMRDLFGPQPVRTSNPTQIRPGVQPGLFRETVWHEAGHMGGDMAKRAMNLDRAVAEHFPSYYTWSQNVDRGSGLVDDVAGAVREKRLSPEFLQKQGQFFKAVQDQLGLDPKYIFSPQEIARYGSEIRSFVSSKYDIGPSDTVTPAMINDFFNNRATKRSIAYKQYAKDIVGGDPIDRWTKFVNAIPAIGAVGAAGAIGMQQQNNQEQQQ